MANLIRKHDLLSPNFFKEFLEDDFLPEGLFHKKLNPPVNISETEKDFIIELSIPGIDKDEIEIQRKGHLMTISYNHDNTKEVEEKNYYRKEFQSISFDRNLKLPENVDLENISSEYKDGILKIDIPKLEQISDKDEVTKIQIK
jgi:HSP20 family protein